jgi:hypothetical protein
MVVQVAAEQLAGRAKQRGPPCSRDKHGTGRLTDNIFLQISAARWSRHFIGRREANGQAAA